MVFRGHGHGHCPPAPCLRSLSYKSSVSSTALFSASSVPSTTLSFTSCVLSFPSSVPSFAAAAAAHGLSSCRLLPGKGPWNSYNNAPKQVKDLWCNEFKRKFNWDETEEDEVRRIFKKKAGDHIRNVMNKAKRSQGKPDFITGDDWTEIKRIWESEKNMQRSEQNKKNRASSSTEGSATYAGGSINIGEHKKRMANELGTEPTYIGIFECTFQKKDKT
ncbi:uncharacterized protein LOC125314839 [Rhodamnia argentea]|uniref:Uncharacterized protein LOC125314839 n=1 Tax=Rhodamnia argentea TaxID=178133 RepID=A0ABM3HBN8_9MYRT|nr:uncharacterized protein LOC125314839 [Rhodamnia argentea]